MDKLVNVEGRELKLTNLEKVFWPEGYTKGDLLAYYTQLAPILLPYIRNRPITMKRYPDGITGKFFYQKDCPQSAPEWIPRAPIASDNQDKVIDYVMINDLPTLLWVINQGCIEIHCPLCTYESLNKPDLAIFDLDPAEPAAYEDTVELALLIKGAMAEFGLTLYPKISGATGLHILFSLRPVHTFEEVRSALRFICELIVQHHPAKATLEHLVKNRTGKVYLDYLQNAWGKNMAWVYSLRPEPGAPVSCPITWEELEHGLIKPGQVNLGNFRERLDKVGDLYA
ncbi:MAG TPA: non-homologous end-joining DNA ligase, partial [Bacillota bacterium]|nr:non-homologous end-joining DNA ligase [Bacillota bacterium]